MKTQFEKKKTNKTQNNQSIQYRPKVFINHILAFGRPILSLDRSVNRK